MQAQVDRATGTILGYGVAVGVPSDTVDVVELRDDQIIHLSEPGTKSLNQDGTITVTPPAPPPLVFKAEQTLTSRIRTTDATVTEVVRATLAPLTGYTALLHLMGVDAGTGAVRVVRASATAKRLTGNALMVGAVTVLADHADAAAATWVLAAGVSGTDFVVTVKGQAGHTIDWSLTLDISSFTPAGA